MFRLLWLFLSAGVFAKNPLEEILTDVQIKTLGELPYELLTPKLQDLVKEDPANTRQTKALTVVNKAYV